MEKQKQKQERKAYDYAKPIYGKTCRPLTRIARIKHIKNLVNILKTVKHTDEMLAAAWLFDLFNRKDITDESRDKFLAEINTKFSTKIALILDGCLPKTNTSDGDFYFRKNKDLEYYTRFTSQSQTIKIADSLEYLQSIRTTEFYTKADDGEKRKTRIKNILLPAEEKLAKSLLKAEPNIRQLLLNTIELMHQELEKFASTT